MNSETATATALETNIPAHLAVGQMEDVYVERPVDKSFKAVVFVGDIMTARQKRTPDHALGGKLFPDKKTLRYCLGSCAITALRKGMQEINEALVDPTKRDRYIKEYIQPNVWNERERRFENVRVGGRNSGAAHLLFREVYPAGEIGAIAYAEQNGVVEVHGVENAADIKRAQLFYFPNWLDIIQGKAQLPKTLRDLRAHLESRLTEAVKLNDLMLEQVGNAFIRSCEDYLAWGKAYLKYQTDAINEAKKHPGVSVRYDEVAERLFGFLEITREDSLIENLTNRQGHNEKLEEVLSILAKNQVEKDNRIDTMFSLMRDILLEKQLVASQTAPTPVMPNAEQAAQIFETASESDEITGEVNAENETAETENIPAAKSKKEKKVNG